MLHLYSMEYLKSHTESCVYFYINICNNFVLVRGDELLLKLFDVVS